MVVSFYIQSDYMETRGLIHNTTMKRRALFRMGTIYKNNIDL